MAETSLASLRKCSASNGKDRSATFSACRGYKLCSLFIKPEVMNDTNLLYDRSQASLPHTTLHVFIIYCYF